MSTKRQCWPCNAKSASLCLIASTVILALACCLAAVFPQAAFAGQNDLVAADGSILNAQSEPQSEQGPESTQVDGETSLQTQATLVPGSSVASYYQPVLNRARYRSGEFNTSASRSWRYWDPHYCLFDMTSDGIPELIVDDWLYEAAHSAYIYTISNGNVVYLGKVSATHSGPAANSTNLYLYGAHMGHFFIKQVRISGNSVYTVSCYDRSSSDPSSEAAVLNGQSSYMKKNKIKGLREYPVTSSSALYSDGIVIGKMSKASISVANVTYNGKAQKPRVVVKYGGKTLRAGTDYTVSYYNNTLVGKGTATVVGKGSYSGTVRKSFTIYPTAKQKAENRKAHSITYQTHVQRQGWQSYKKDGAVAGTSGKSLRLEGIKIKPNGKWAYSGGVQYRTHVQNIGWEKTWKSNGNMSGTQGRSLRLEAIQLKLTGNMAKHYDVYYRVHAQHFGWMGWAKNGARAGTAGYSYRLEAIQIKLVPKGYAAPGSTANAFRQR